MSNALTSREEPDVLEMVRLYEAGHGTAEIAQRFRVHPATIHRWLRDFGVQMRPRGSRSNPEGRWLIRRPAENRGAMPLWLQG